MDANFTIEPVNHYGLNIYNPNGALIATAPQIDGLFCLDISQTGSARIKSLTIYLGATPILAAVKQSKNVALNL
jgi:hypothetical protein